MIVVLAFGSQTQASIASIEPGTIGNEITRVKRGHGGGGGGGMHYYLLHIYMAFFWRVI